MSTVTDTSIEVMEHAVLRAAGWPIEIVEAFAALGLAAASRRLARTERRVADRRPAVIAVLHESIPRIASPSVRHWLLTVKRHVHRDHAPLPDVPQEWAPELRTHKPLWRALHREAWLRRVLASREATFDGDCRTTMERQRSELRRIANEPRFQRALSVSAPVVAQQWNRADGNVDPSRSKGRRLEAAVFHYLMRAAGRPTPNGAWAGIAPVRPSETAGGSPALRVLPACRRYRAAVSLLPFATMARALAAQPRYWHGCPLRLNPTLHPDESGWRYERCVAGVSTWTRLEWSALAAIVIDHFGDGQPRLSSALLELLTAGSPMSVNSRQQSQRVIDSLIVAGVLQVDLELPAAAPDAWTAIDALVGRLLPPDRPRFERGLASIRAACARLGSEFDTLQPADVIGLSTRVETEIRELWRACGLPDEPPRPSLYLDMRLPFDVTWNKASIEAAGAAIAGRLTFHDLDGSAELYRRLLLEDIVCACRGSDGVSLLGLLSGRIQIDRRDPTPTATGTTGWTGRTRRWIFSRFALTDEQLRTLASQESNWESLLEAHHRDRAVVVPIETDLSSAISCAAGAMILSIAGDGNVWTGPGRPQPGMFVSRVADLLADSSGDEVAIVTALRNTLATFGQRSRRAIVEVVGSDTMNPNAALRPTLASMVLDPHGPSPCNLQGVELFADHTSCRVWLRHARARGKIEMLPVYNSGARMGHVDPCSAFLQLIAVAQGWETVSFGVPTLEIEARQWHHLPRLLLPGGATLSAERWTVDRIQLRAIGMCRGAHRYRRWRALVDELGLPNLVLAQCGPDAADLLVRTDSPLAVRCLFDGPAGDAPWMILTELPADIDKWPVRDEGGQHYLAELAVTWLTSDRASEDQGGADAT